MGCKAEGAAQGFTLLGALVLLVYAFQMLIGGANLALSGVFEGVIETALAITLILIVVLAVDASGYVDWRIAKNGGLLAVFGFIAIMVVLRHVSFDVIGWLMNAGTLAGLMILVAGILVITKS
ncbi:MAG: hypothetical protein ACXADS_01330 [Candidatus Thorarchaeota archaeon]|jgi:hypothetical protein